MWIKDVEVVESVDDLKTLQSIGRRRFPNFAMPDAKIASAVTKIIMNSYFKKVSLEEQLAQMEDRFLHGRQIASMIYDYLQVNGAPGAVLDFSNLFGITLHGDDFQDFFIPDGTKLHRQSVNFPMTVFWKVCMRCENESVTNTKQYWQCTNQKSITIYRSRVIRSRRPW